MTATWLGLAVEFLLFALGLYIYLFSRGFFKFGNEEVRQRSEQFRRENAGWMRIMGLLLAAVMLMNMIFHFREMMG